VIRKLFLPIGIIVFASMTACATPRGRVYVRVGPPAPVVERRIVAPGPGYVWVPGYYMWNGAAYVLAPGRWARPPRARAVWVPAHWQRDRHGWFIIEGHWR
jgi:WXXGXW repeat (2 copies)